jgi:hypothetical protein
MFNRTRLSKDGSIFHLSINTNVPHIVTIVVNAYLSQLIIFDARLVQASYERIISQSNINVLVATNKKNR